jgi:DNA-binding PadR family transcriptional regulator
MENVDYHTLQKLLKRSRTTVVRSLESLRKHHFVRAQQTDPGNERSKLIFNVTAKGFYYAIAFLNLDPDQAIRTSYAENKKEMKKYNEYIRSVPDFNSREDLLIRFSKVIMEYNPFDNKGNVVANDFQRIMSLGFMYGMIESIKGGKSLFEDTNLDLLSKAFHPKELEQIRKFCLNMKDFVDSTLQKPPDDTES